MKLIEILISPTGETQLQTRGFVGSTCQTASHALEQALGLVAQEQRTSEYFLAAEQAAQQRTES
jgi:hypothetical protein